MSKIADVVIIGAGVIGLSTAYNLARAKPDLRIVIVEKEKFHGAGSTAQCTGGIRHQFTNPVNILLTKISYPYFQRFAAEMQYPIYFRKRGYLFVTGQKKHFETVKIITAELNGLEIPSELLSPKEIGGRFPFLETRDILWGSFCPLDAYADPYGVMEGYYKACRSMGVELLCNTGVQSVNVGSGGVKGVKTSGIGIDAPVVINAAGPHLHLVARTAGVELPASPYRRQVYVCAPLRDIPADIPLIVDMDTGFYIHAEKNGILLLGGTDRDNSPGLEPIVDRSKLFSFIEAATMRIPLLQEAEITRIYTGLRSLTPDGLGVLGETEVRGFYCLGGFSGNGFMHAPAIGLVAACLVLGENPPLDPQPLSPQRFTGKGISEKNLF